MWEFCDERSRGRRREWALTHASQMANTISFVAMKPFNLSGTGRRPQSSMYEYTYVPPYKMISRPFSEYKGSRLEQHAIQRAKHYEDMERQAARRRQQLEERDQTQQKKAQQLQRKQDAEREKLRKSREAHALRV